MLVCLYAVWLLAGHKAQLSSFNRDHMACKLKTFTVQIYAENLCFSHTKKKRKKMQQGLRAKRPACTLFPIGEKSL